MRDVVPPLGRLKPASASFLEKGIELSRDLLGVRSSLPALVFQNRVEAFVCGNVRELPRFFVCERPRVRNLLRVVIEDRLRLGILLLERGKDVFELLNETILGRGF